MVNVVNQTNEWIDFEVDGHKLHLVLFESGEMELFEGTKEQHDLVSDSIPESVFEEVQTWANNNLPTINN